MARNVLFVIDGTPYGGKTSLLTALQKDNQGTVNVIRRITTRPRRIGNNGIKIREPDYRFVSDEGFQKLKELGKFLFTEKNCGYWYGVLWADIKRALTQRKNTILVANLKSSLKEIQSQYTNTEAVFISPVRVGHGANYSKRKLRQVILKRIKNRECKCELPQEEDYVEIAQRQIDNLKQLGHVAIVENNNGSRGFQNALRTLENIILAKKKDIK